MKKYFFEEKRDKGGIGSRTTYETREEAVKACVQAWEHMCEKDRKSYIKDPAPFFLVHYSDCEWDEDFEDWIPFDIEDVILDMLDK